MGYFLTEKKAGNILNAPSAIAESTDSLTLSYDARNRLRSAGGVSYQYDFEGNRTKVIGTETENWVHDPVSSALSRTINGQTTYYIWGRGLVHLINPGGSTSTYHLDQVGSTDTPFLYAGQFGIQQDANGLLHMRARYYSPELRRFINADPIGFAGGMNWYQYANNSPLMYVDPSGHVVETAWDVANIGLGAYSLQDNVRNGRWGWAILDAVGLAYDGIATAVPFLPAGVSAGLKAARAGNSAVNSVQVGLDVAKVADATHDAARSVDAGLNARTAGTRIHREVAEQVDGRLFNLDSTYMAGANGASGPRSDLIGSGVWGDITTAGQWRAHERRYNSLFGDGIPIIYQRGKGITNSSRIFSGAGVGINTFKQAIK